MDEENPGFNEWCVLDLMGHRRLAGHVTEQQVGGTNLLRIDVYRGDSPTPVATQLYSAAAVFCITPTTEAIARRLARSQYPVPVARWELEAPADVTSVGAEESISSRVVDDFRSSIVPF